MNAQRDVTSKYITNATLSDGTNGWVVSNFNAPQQGKNAVGYASECWAGNGASANPASYSLTQTITLPAGNYRLVNYSFYRYSGHYNDDVNKSLAFLKAGDKSVAVKTLGSVAAPSYANSQAEGANVFESKMYRNVIEFEVDADNTSIEIGLTGTHDAPYSWVICGMFELFDLDDAASVSSPTDVTYAITNPGFEYRDLTGWTNKGLIYQDNNWAEKSGIGFAEQWANNVALGSDKSITQTLKNMPAGMYELSVYAHNIEQYNGNAAGTGMFLTANTNKTEITSFGQYKVRTTLTEAGDLTIGINLDNCTGNWIACDRFGLLFYGDPLEAAKDLLTVAVEKAQALVNGNTIPTAAEEALQAVIDANDNDDNAFTTEDQFNTAVENINTAYDTYKALESAYSLWLEAKTGAEALVLVENNNATATSTLNTAIGTQNAAAEAATTADGINTATADLKTAILSFAKAADPTSGNRFNLTCLLTNHDVTGLPTWTGASGWYTDQTGGNSQVMTNDGVKSDDGKNAFYEYWSETPAANNKFTLYQKLTLPQGTYSIKCYAFSDQPTGGDNRGVYFYANDTQGSLVNNSKLTEQGISFINDEEQEVKIGLKALTGNTYRWMGIGYVELYKEYTDNTTFTITTNTIANGTVAVTVDGDPATSAKALKTVTLTYIPEEGYRVSNVVATYNDGEKDVNLDVANPSENVYTFQMPAYNVTVNTTTVVDKRELTANIETAAGLIDKNVGTGVFQIPSDANEALKSAKSAAETVNSNAAATVSDVASANSALATAISTFRGAALNAPAADKRYNLTIVEEGKAWNGNAITFIAGARTAETQGGEMGGYGIKYLAPANANLNQALKFTAVDGEVNTYKVSAVNAATGAEQYLTTGSTYGGNNDQIRTTDDASKAMWIKAEATTTGGQFQIRNMSANKIIANNNNNDMYTANSVNFTIAEASQATVNVTIAADVKYATRIFPFTPALPSGVKAYSCEAATDATLTLVEVAAPAANVPYILEAESGCASTDLTGWGTAGAETYTTGWLTGVYTATDAPVASYVLQNNDSKVAFYVVAEGEQPTVGANRCYLTVPTTARPAFFFGDDNTTGIEAINALTNGTAEIYNVNGVKVPALQKGMNIVKTANGKTQKILVK